MAKNLRLLTLLCLALPSLVIASVLDSSSPSSPTPVVIWHGMGDSCCNPWSMGYIKGLLEKHLPGVYVHSLMVGDSVVQDTENGFFMDVNRQVDMVCAKIAADGKLRGGQVSGGEISVY